MLAGNLDCHKPVLFKQHWCLGGGAPDRVDYGVQLDQKVAGLVRRVQDASRRRNFFLAFSQSPVDFINALIASQVRAIFPLSMAIWLQPSCICLCAAVCDTLLHVTALQLVVHACGRASDI